MITQVLYCPYRQGIGIVKNAKTPQRKRGGRTFILDYTYAGQLRRVKKQIIDMVLNGSGIQDTARRMSICT